MAAPPRSSTRQGDIWVATSNSAFSSASDAYDDSDGVVELSPSLVPVQYFAPASWYSDNGSDLDLGSSAPALVSNGLAFQSGKSGTGYLLSQASLGGIGHRGARRALVLQRRRRRRGGGVRCHGVRAVPVRCRGRGHRPAQQHRRHVAHRHRWGGPPIVAGGLVWSIDTGNDTLDALDTGVGGLVQSLPLGSEANHFPTPSVADGLLLAPSSDQVHAFDGPAGLPPPPSPAPARAGYWTTASDGGVFSFGGAQFHGSMGGTHLVAPVVGMAATAGGGGYWLVASDGGIFAFGDAGFSGSMGGKHLAAPMVAIAAAPDGGYWTVASDGGVFAFGGAGYFGSTGGTHLAAPVVGMAPTSDGGGYWLVARDGGVFAFGDARFAGSMGGMRLAAPMVGIAPAPGGGYWTVASDGGVFAFGGAGYFGSMGGRALSEPVVAVTPTSDGEGYWEVASDGGIFAFGDAPFEGSVAGVRLVAPMVAMAAPPLP